VPPRLKAFIQYTIIVGLTTFLIWFSLRGLIVYNGGNKLTYLKHTWDSANKSWLLTMAGVAILSHIVRAARWRMLIEPAGYHPRLSNSFLSLMVGYLVNLVIPRGGEVSRCYNLYKLDKTPVETSFGTVVVERIVDMICLLILIALCFIIESEKLMAFIDTLPFSSSGSSKFLILIYLGIGCCALFFLAWWIIKRNERLLARLVKIWNGFKSGLLTIFQLKNKGLFITYSILIWVLYFVTSYTVLMAFTSTSELGLHAVLSLFAIGSIAMAAPLPGGTGAYHVLVPQGLVFLYKLPLSDAIAFTFIFHGWQTFIMIIAGAASLLITSFRVKKNSKVD
jgi:glycosyltransferase 2 family protein